MMNRYYILILVSFVLILGCQKSKDVPTNNNPQQGGNSLDYTLSFPDSLVFENLDTILASAKIKQISGPENLQVILNLDYTFPEGIGIADNTTTNGWIDPFFEFKNSYKFVCSKITPGVYPFEVRAKIESLIKTKTSYVVIRPQCGFYFAKTLTTKTISYPSLSESYSGRVANFTSTNSLIIANVYSGNSIELNFDCDNKTVEMVSFYSAINGKTYTGNGYFNDSTIYLNIYADGVIFQTWEFSK